MSAMNRHKMDNKNDECSQRIKSYKNTRHGTPEGTRLHYGANSVKPEFGGSPPDFHIQMGSSPFRLKQKSGNAKRHFLIFGTPEGTRTPNPRNRNPMLYPLSHRRMS